MFLMVFSPETSYNGGSVKFEKFWALLNQNMNANCAGSRAKVSLGLGFKNPRQEDSYLKSATPGFHGYFLGVGDLSFYQELAEYRCKSCYKRVLGFFDQKVAETKVGKSK